MERLANPENKFVLNRRNHGKMVEKLRHFAEKGKEFNQEMEAKYQALVQLNEPQQMEHGRIETIRNDEANPKNYQSHLEPVYNNLCRIYRNTEILKSMINWKITELLNHEVDYRKLKPAVNQFVDQKKAEEEKNKAQSEP